MKLDMVITSIPQNYHGEQSTDTLRTLLVFHNDDLGIVTENDTLALVFQKKEENKSLFVETYYNLNQSYYVIIVQDKRRFTLFVTPYKPYKKLLRALIITSI